LDGTPCRAWAVRGTEPPRCSAHGGTAARSEGEQRRLEALRHACFAEPELPKDCTIDAVIDVLFQRQLRLEMYLREIWDSDVELKELAQLLRVHGQNAFRLGKLLRDQRALAGEASDGLAAAVSHALDELSTEMGVDL
jgi:hypothetical protein